MYSLQDGKEFYLAPGWWIKEGVAIQGGMLGAASAGVLR
jgi:hypothetical protein